MSAKLKLAAETPKPVNQPPTFTDSAERVWTIKLTVGLIEQVQERLQFDLVPDDCDATPLVELWNSIKRMGDLLWALVENQAEARGVTRSDFLNALDNEAIPAAWGALCDSIVFFIQRYKSERAAGLFLAAVEAGMKVKEEEAGAIIRTIQSSTTDEAIKKKVRAIEQAMQKELVEELGKSPLRSPGSSGSTRGRSR